MDFKAKPLSTYIFYSRIFTLLHFYFVFVFVFSCPVLTPKLSIYSINK